MSPAPISAVVFDLDGTLIDSVPDLRVALNALLSDHGRRAVNDSETASFVGNGAPKLVERAFRATGDALGPDSLEDMTAAFLGYYEGNECVLTDLYPGVRDTLDTLKQKGIAMAICTNKPQAPTVNILKHYAMDTYFGAVIGGDVMERKPHPAPLLWCLDQLGTAPEKALMVGDTINDIDAAKGAGVRSVAVSFGYSQGRHHDFGADHLVDALPEILALLP